MDWLSKKPAHTLAAPVVGTMNFGQRTTAEESERIIARALERGVTWFDTANAYTGGESERILGRALKAHRGQVQLATKCGIGTLGGPKEGLSPRRIADALDASLDRLGMERVDLFYLHAPDPKTPVEDTIVALEKARAAGKIGEWGVSNYASWQIMEMLAFCQRERLRPPRISQVIYNLLVRQLDIEYFAFAEKFALHTTIYNPLAGGLLAGKGLGGKIESGSRFDTNPWYQKRYLTERFFELVRAFGAVARDAGMDTVQLAYAWVSQRAGVDSVLLGPASVEQLDAGLEGCARKLPREVVVKIDELHRAYLGTDAVYAR